MRCAPTHEEVTLGYNRLDVFCDVKAGASLVLSACWRVWLQGSCGNIIGEVHALSRLGESF